MIQDHVSTPGIGCSCLNIEVRNPRTHIDRGKALYTDYEIHVKTNHPCFPLIYSKTRRRYSDFVWLRNKLGLGSDITLVAAPRLPRKQLIGRFKEGFLQERNDGLQVFLNRLVEVHAYLQDPSLQLFLQTRLATAEMDHYLKTRTMGAIKSLIMKLHKRGLNKSERTTSIRQQSYEYPLTKRSPRAHIGGRGWSSQYGDGYYSMPFVCDNKSRLDTKGVRQRSTTLNAGALPGGRLTLPSIPGSIDDGLPGSGSEFTDEEAGSECGHPLSASWNGSEHDHIDFLLDDYEIIPLCVITQIEQKLQAEISELGYLDLTYTTTDPLNSYSNEQPCFD